MPGVRTKNVRGREESGQILLHVHSQTFHLRRSHHFGNSGYPTRNNHFQESDPNKIVKLSSTNFEPHAESPEQMQSQRNYGSFLSKSHLHSVTLLKQCLPKISQKVKDNALIEQSSISRSNTNTGGSNWNMFEIMWQVLI